MAPTATATESAEPTASPSEAPSASPTEAPSATASAEPTDSASPSAGADIVVNTDSTGAYLIAPDGFSLYIFDSDDAGVSNCSGECIENWPPFTTDGQAISGGDGVAGTFDVTIRDDGTEQITYNDSPLYFYADDEAPGDTNGDGVGDVWHLAAP
jgi:predicted lipoprotein with Yx(FWY)xxD motif